MDYPGFIGLESRFFNDSRSPGSGSRAASHRANPIHLASVIMCLEEWITLSFQSLGLVNLAVKLLWGSSSSESDFPTGQGHFG